MATGVRYQRLPAQQEQMNDVAPINGQIAQVRNNNEGRMQRAQGAIREAGVEMNRQPAYVRRIQDRTTQLERKVEELQQNQKKNESKRDGLAECAGRCVSVTLRTIAYPFWWLGNTIAKATGCKK